MDLPKAIKLFVIARQADGRAPATIRDYYRVLAPFDEWCSKPLARLTKDDVRAYVAGLRVGSWSPGHVAIHVRNLRAFLRWLADEGYTKENLALAIKAPKGASRIESPITDAEIARMLDTCDQMIDDAIQKNTPRCSIELAALRDRAIILFMYDTGLRACEIIPLKISHLFKNEAVSYLIIHSPKSDNMRAAILGNAATLALVDYLKLRVDSPAGAPLFAALYGSDRPIGYNGLYKMLRRRARLAGLDESRVHPHIFRKAFITSALDNGMDAERVRVLAGWQSLEMLKVYVASDLARLCEAHRRAGPVDHMLGFL